MAGGGWVVGMGKWEGVGSGSGGGSGGGGVSRQCAHYSGRHSRPQEIAHFIFLVKLWLT